MVVIGGVLAEMALKSVFTNWQVYVVSAMIFMSTLFCIVTIPVIAALIA